MSALTLTGSSQTLLATVRVADGMPEPTTDVLVRDLTHMVHDGAAEHYGRSNGCKTLSFSSEHGGGRSGFGVALAKLGAAPDKISEYLAEWDGSSRPVAIIHWWVA